MNRIAVVGAGSLGAITGALIADQGRNIELIDTNRAHVDAMNENGVRITGALDRVIPVDAKLPDQLNGVYDLVFLLTKQTATESALTSISPFLSSDSIVCTLQNGTPEDKVASIVGVERTVAGNVQFAAIWREPGVCELSSTLEVTRAHAFDLGELDGSHSERIGEIAEILSAVGQCSISSNITGMKWSKLVVNSMFSGLSAALGCDMTPVIDDPTLIEIALRVAEESIRTGWAHGITVDDVFGRPAERFTEASGPVHDENAEFLVRILMQHPHAEASMLQDLRKGIPTERDFINGRVLEVAAKHGVDVPFNQALYRLITEAEESRTVPGFATNRSVLHDLLT